MLEQMSAAEWASIGSSAKQANEWAVQVNKQMVKQVAQYFLQPNSWFFWSNVEGVHKKGTINSEDRGGEIESEGNH